jgi:hypothetical protein
MSHEVEGVDIEDEISAGNILGLGVGEQGL